MTGKAIIDDSSADRGKGEVWSRAAGLAPLGLAFVLIFLSVFAIWGAASTYYAGREARHSNELNDVFANARAAVAAEESLERKYRLEPSPAVRERHRAASV